MSDDGGIARLVPVYQRRPTPLHATRASVGAFFCAALVLPALLYESPIVLAGALLGIAAVGVGARVGGQLARALRLAIPIAVLITLINPLVYSNGATLLVRGGTLLGHRFDITLEALTYGAVAGLRVVVLVVGFGLFSAVVDPDELLRLFRRISHRSALTAALTTRLVPVLARDASCRADAARCRPNPPSRTALARAALSGTLDRAIDLAAALESRGYALATRPHAHRTPWSRHDLSFALAALLISGLMIIGAVEGYGWFEAYPRLGLGAGLVELGLATLSLLIAAMPFAAPGARLGVARV